jgi:hypothetical protein
MSPAAGTRAREATSIWARSPLPLTNGAYRTKSSRPDQPLFELRLGERDGADVGLGISVNHEDSPAGGSKCKRGLKTIVVFPTPPL